MEPPTHSEDDEAPITTPYTSPDHPYKEYSLEHDVRRSHWKAYEAPCMEAIQALGYEQPRSYNQLKAMWLVLAQKSNMFLLLPTGFGKTALFQFIAKLSNDLVIDGVNVGGNSIVVTPYAALLEAHVKSSRDKNIPTYNWQRDRHEDVHPNTRLVFVQPESFITERFQS